MISILHILTLRTIILMASSVFSVAFVMLMVGIVTIDDIIKILNLSPDAANALRVIFSRFQEVTNNLIHIIGQLLNNLVSWTGTEIDTSKLVDINHGTQPAFAPSEPNIDTTQIPNNGGSTVQGSPVNEAEKY
ncbi:MAG: hypothetical protein LW595_02965 [Rickettsiales bacterium]|nr:hypothetical protein [Rickettsiales bacterium]